jgi:hypothetical protein
MTVEVFDDALSGWSCTSALLSMQRRSAAPPKSKSSTRITSDVRTTFVPVDVHKPSVLMCDYTGKEVV